MTLVMGCSHSHPEPGFRESGPPPLARLFSRQANGGVATACSCRQLQEGPELMVSKNAPELMVSNQAPELIGKNSSSNSPQSPYHTVRVTRPVQARPMAEDRLPDPTPSVSHPDPKVVSRLPDPTQEAANPITPVLRVERKPEQQQAEPQPVPVHNLLDVTPARPNRERRSFGDVTAHPAFSHDKDYHWLIGTVEQKKGTSQWEIRYASVDEDDVYGGHLLLVPAATAPNLKSGQLVRVEGYVLEGADRATFRAQSVRPLYPQD
jgi:hypothetical protein